MAAIQCVPMTVEQLEQVDAALLCISEARERLERLARALGEEAAEAARVRALEDAERQLLDLHNDLRRKTYFPGPGATPQTQLQLAASA